MFIIIMHYKKSLDEIDKYLEKHRQFLDEGYKHNYFVASGPKVPRTGGIIISNLKDKVTLLDLLKDDPFYQQDIVEFEIIEFQPVKYHPLFAHFI